jgi:putative transport protein
VLIMGLILGYLRSRTPVFGKLPAPAGWLLETLGLNTFIAIVGLSAGLSFIAGLKTFGIPLLISGILAVLIPHTLTLLIGKYLFPKINLGVLLGIASGAGTNTPALLAVQEAADSKVPVLGLRGALRHRKRVDHRVGSRAREHRPQAPGVGQLIREARQSCNGSLPP